MPKLMDVFAKDDKILDRIKQRANKLSKYVDMVNEIEDEIKRQKTIEKYTFLLAADEVQSELRNILMNGVVESCIRSKEFNYPPFIRHLLNASLKNIDKILTYKRKPSIKNIKVRARFDILGTADQWAKVASAVRKAHGWGKTRGRDYQGEDLASRKWREIYQVAREGKRVTKKHTTTDKKTGKTTTKTIDMSDKLRDKYEYTIRERLSLLPPDKAPYWYIIEHGNATQFGGGTGTPYPQVEPVGMSFTIESKIEEIFDKTLKEFEERAEEIFLEDLYKDLDIKRKSKTFDFLDEDLRERVEELLSSEEGIEVVATKTGQTIKGINDAYIRKTTKGTLVVQPRIGGRFGAIIK